MTTTAESTVEQITRYVADNDLDDWWDDLTGLADTLDDEMHDALSALAQADLTWSVGSYDLGDAVAMAGRWIAAVDDSPAGWLAAGCFEPEAAKAMEAEGIDVDDLLDRNRQPLHTFADGPCLGYQVANNNLSAKRAAAIVRMVRGDSFTPDEALTALNG